MTAEVAKSETQTPQKQEKQANCPGCGKQIKRLKRYYRNGKFYCSKKCWRKGVKEKSQEAKDK